MGQFPTSNLPDSVQQLAESLRTRNQQFTQQQVSTDLDIAQLRGMEELLVVVADQLSDIRTSIPALSAARSAPPPGQLPEVDTVQRGGLPDQPAGQHVVQSFLQQGHQQQVC